MQKNKSERALKTIGEVADILKIEPHVIRFWESNFKNLIPVKLGNRRYYSPENVVLLEQIQALLHKNGYSIKDAILYFKQPIHPLLKLKNKLLKAHAKLMSILNK